MEHMETTIVTLTLTTVVAFLALLVGGMIGWLARQHSYETAYAQTYIHTEFIDENGNVIADEVIALRFENDNDNDEEDD